MDILELEVPEDSQVRMIFDLSERWRIENEQIGKRLNQVIDWYLLWVNLC